MEREGNFLDVILSLAINIKYFIMIVAVCYCLGNMLPVYIPEVYAVIKTIVDFDVNYLFEGNPESPIDFVDFI